VAGLEKVHPLSGSTFRKRVVGSGFESRGLLNWSGAELGPGLLMNVFIMCSFADLFVFY
jgi:hypothetical protein